MLKMGLIGLGGMGRGHLTMIEQLIADGLDVECRLVELGGGVDVPDDFDVAVPVQFVHDRVDEGGVGSLEHDLDGFVGLLSDVK